MFGLGGRVFDEPFHLHSSVKQDAFKKLLNKSPAMLRCSHGHNVPSHLIPVETKKAQIQPRSIRLDFKGIVQI